MDKAKLKDLRERVLAGGPTNAWRLSECLALLDILDACETERDRLRAELDAAHDGEDALRSEVAKLRAQIAALQSVPQGVEVPEEIQIIEGRVRAKANRRDQTREREDAREAVEVIDWFRARLVPTPHKPLHPEERRGGPDEVVVGREEYIRDLQTLLNYHHMDEPQKGHEGACHPDAGCDGDCANVYYHHLSVRALETKLDALRTSAQDHNGEESK